MYWLDIILKLSRKLLEKVGTSRSSDRRHLKTIGKVKNIDKLILHELTEKQRSRRLEVCAMAHSRF